jgi:hypothetical protein
MEIDMSANETAVILPAERQERPSRLPMVPTASSPMQMIAIAVQRGDSMESIKQLMDLKDRWEAGEARKAFDEAVAAAKAEIKPIVKNREVDFTNREGKRTNYRYEDLASIAEAIDPILAKYGLSYRYRSKQDGKILTITCVLSHRAGHFEETTLSAGNDESGNKNAIQSVASAATFLQRYTVKLALGLAASNDDDGRNAGGETVTYVNAEQIDAIRKLGEEVGADKDQFLKLFKVDAVEKIPAMNFDAVIALLKAKRAAKRRVPEGDK